MEDVIFWADKFAGDIVGRKKYAYLDKEYALPRKPSIKTSSSLSGVLHIGRLTDIVRGEAVYRALKDKGVKAEFIYVAEDMDPLRKIPKGIPASYKKYIGVPVTDIPDPWGCHDNYAEHHVREFFDVFAEFVEEEPNRYSMRAEYKKGSFNDSIDIILKNRGKIKDIVEGFKDNPLPEDWVPYQPVCEKCGKIMTTKATGIEDGKIKYVCQDYSFKSEKAEGCKHEGVADLKKGNGKLVWKSEWAAQWKHWDVVSEGAGKEYVVPNSAFFVNAHIVEKVLDYPAPTPIFYEHITIGGGGKMSASLGNVVYPKEWLQVAPAEALRLLFLKRITQARDFKWEDVPRLMDELDSLEAVYYGREKAIDEREEKHLKRLYEMVLTTKPAKRYEERAPYNTAAMVSQIVSLDDRERLVSVLRKLGYEMTERTDKLLPLAETWANKYSEGFEISKEIPLEAKKFTKQQKQALLDIVGLLDKEWNEKEFNKALFDTARSNDLKPTKLFETVYMALLSRKRGPRASPFVLSLDRGFVKRRFRLEG
jgi:lysyl-tRNA synthetase class 1